MFSVILFSFLSITAVGQRGKSSIVKYETKAQDGKVVLTNGTELKGQIVFNDNDGVVTVYAGEASHSFYSRRVLKFEFYDDNAARYRLFYSLEYSDPETGFTDMEIFEVLKELNSFAVLVKIDRIRTEARKGLLEPTVSPMLVDRSSKKFMQTQTVFFMNQEGTFEPYLRIVEKEFDGGLLDYNERNTRYIDAGLFRKYTGDHYRALMEYAKANKLSFRRKADIIRILEEYQNISE